MAHWSFEFVNSLRNNFCSTLIGTDDQELNYERVCNDLMEKYIPMVVQWFQKSVAFWSDSEFCEDYCPEDTSIVGKIS